MRMKFINFVAVLVPIFLISGCDSLNVNDALKERPPHLITNETLYTTYNGFQSGLNGLYATVRLELTGLHSSTAPRDILAKSGTDVLATNLPHVGWSYTASRYGDDLNPSNSWISDWFAWVYEIVNAANTIIHQAENSNNVDWAAGDGSAEENRMLVIAEARAIRAWAYRHLTYLWGDVPLVLTPSSGATIRTDWTRSPVNEVRQQIIDDLLFAEQHIPVERAFRGRITKGAVQHYLAEIYLAMDDPDTALSWADQVINNPEYQLITERYGVRSDRPGVPFMDMFYDGNSNRDEGNTEALWVFPFAQNVPGGSVAHRNRHYASRYSEIVIEEVAPLQNTFERGGRGATISSPTNFALGLWEEGDDRGSNYAVRWYYILKNEEANAPYPADRLPPGYAYGDTIWTEYSEVLSPTNTRVPRRPFPRKVEGTDPNNVSTSSQWNDQIYLRLAETYLVKAEAEYLLGNAPAAAETVNVLRRRANATEISPGDVDVDFILDERSRELIAEEHRRYHLLRTGKWLERVGAHNFHGGQNIDERHLLLPIPQDVIDANLTGDFPQNPGY